MARKHKKALPRMGDYMDGYENYERLISDHLPVFLSF